MSETWLSLLSDAMHHPRVCSNCFRDRRGATEQDFYRTSGGSNSELRTEWCVRDGTAPPWTPGAVSEHWDRDPLPARGDAMSLRACLSRLFDRLAELADVEPDRDAGLDAALDAKCDPEVTPDAGRWPPDAVYLAVGLRAALDSADVDLS
ncbi:hypothetical protein [Halopenitus persicus]|uniref:hypothetical protein n=1 Tax=Halopenitus persicus TaxID=1048396 RepID=UPI0012FD1750|nr:hypothetical protein [Halopenitus persicus]